MHGHWTKPQTSRRIATLLLILMSVAALWASGPALGSGPAKSQARSPDRPLMLAVDPTESPRLLPFSGRPRPLAGDAGTGLMTRANWRKLKIPAGPNGHFYVTARVKKQPPSYALVDITFLVDTGASLVALTKSDAEALGFEMRDLDFSGISQTANGEVRYAAVMLPELRVGSFKIKDVPASVVDGDLEISLLGNSFLSRLKSYQVANDQLVLRW